MKISKNSLSKIEIAIVSLRDFFTNSENDFTDIYIKLEKNKVLLIDDYEKIISTAEITSEDAISFIEVENLFVSTLKNCINKCKDLIDNLNIVKPFSIILLDSNDDIVEDLYLVDDDIVILDKELLPELSDDLGDFFDKLMKD